MSGAIELSVVVAASWSAEAAGRTVASIGATDGVEVIVASDPIRVAPGPLPDGVPWVVGERGDGVPRLRRVGADAARGRVVAFVEDACVVGPGWAGAIRSGFRDGDCLAATGPVLQGVGASATDWAVYFAEYAPFAGPIGPLPGGWGTAEARPTRLAGINFACLRESIGPSATIREAGLSTRLSGSIRWLEGASVHHSRHYSIAGAIADRWRFGREFGRERWEDRPGRLRWLGPAAAPAILAVQLGRLIHCLARDRSLRKPALASCPQTLALLMAWSAGEALGWAGACRDGWRRRGTVARRPASGPAPAPSGPAGCKSPPAVA
jgi:hypothetical protein